jgi:outer membrane protein TolC
MGTAGEANGKNMGQIERSRLVLVSAAAVVLLSVNSAAGQEKFTGSLDVGSAVSRALENDPQLRASRVYSAIAQEKVREAREGRRPTVEISQAFTRSNNPASVFGSLLEQGRLTAPNPLIQASDRPGSVDHFRSAVSVKVPIFDQRGTRGRVRRSEIESTRASLQADIAAQRLRFEVVKAFYAVILADELLAVTNAAVRSSKENSRKTEAYVSVGMVPMSDSLVASVELANVEQRKLEAESAVVTTRATLNIAMGADPMQPVELVGSLREKYFPLESENELVRIALERRPEYQRSLLAIDDRRQETRSIRDQKLPKLDAFGEFSYGSPDLTRGRLNYTVGLDLTYTLVDPGRKSRLAQAELSEVLAAAEREKLENQITLEVITAAQVYRTAMAKIRTSIRSVIQAEEALRIVQDRYKSGVAAFDPVLQAEAALLRAHHDLLSARYEYYVGYASVLLATGRLTDVTAFDH